MSRPGAGGDRRSQAEVAKHLRIVEERLVDGIPRHRLVVEFARKKVGESTLDRYIAQVHEHWRNNAERAAPHVREQRKARIRMLADEARAAGKYSACAQFERMLNEIEGVGAPIFVPVPIGAGGGTPLDLKEVADGFLEMLEAEVDKVLRSRPPAGLIGDGTLVEANNTGGGA